MQQVYPQPNVIMADVVEDAQLACAILLAHQQHGVKKLITFHKKVGPPQLCRPVIPTHVADCDGETVCAEFGESAGHIGT